MAGFDRIPKELEYNRRELEQIKYAVENTNSWMDAFSNVSMWSHIFQIAGLVLLALILWRVW